MALQYRASAKVCGVEQRAPPIVGRAAITLGIGPHSSCMFFCFFLFLCMVTDFSAAEKNSSVKLCVLLQLLSGMSFYHFGGQRSRSTGTKNVLSAANTHPGAYEWYSLRSMCSRSGRAHFVAAEG